MGNRGLGERKRRERGEKERQPPPMKMNVTLVTILTVSGESRSNVPESFFYIQFFFIEGRKIRQQCARWKVIFFSLLLAILTSALNQGGAKRQASQESVLYRSDKKWVDHFPNYRLVRMKMTMTLRGISQRRCGDTKSGCNFMHGKKIQWGTPLCSSMDQSFRNVRCK